MNPMAILHRLHDLGLPILADAQCKEIWTPFDDSVGRPGSSQRNRKSLIADILEIPWLDDEGESWPLSTTLLLTQILCSSILIIIVRDPA